jgi:hypothetical protein
MKALGSLWRSAALAAFLAGATCGGSGAAAAPSEVLRVSPKTVHFGTRPVWSFTLKGATVTNTGPASVQLLVTIDSAPDDFSFGLLPGSTCPALEPAPLAPGEGCEAVMGFRPSDFFAGQRQEARLLATATDPVTGTVLDTALITFEARGR